MNILTILLCIIVNVYDGDTVKCRDGEYKDHRIRLLSIDTPEKWSPKCKAQPYSVKATDRLKELISGKEVEVYIAGKDKYKRDLGYIYLNGEDINLIMIKEGWAEVYRGDQFYIQNPYYPYEEKARINRIGMWKIIDWGEYESPRRYRKRCH